MHALCDIYIRPPPALSV